MYATERHDRISSTITTVGRVSVAELATRFDVTAETIRRDLDVLEQRGLLRRVHGGAVSAASTTVAEAPLAERLPQRREQKDAIARAAMRLLPSTFQGSILIDAGSTTAGVAELLAARAPGGTMIDVSTNALPIASILSGRPGLAVRMLGGTLRGITGAAVGTATLDQLQGLRPDLAFVGANGISAAFGLSTPDELEAAVKSAMVRTSRRVVVLADSSKLGAEALVRFARLDEVDTLITDAAPDARLAAALDDAGVEVVLA